MQPLDSQAGLEGLMEHSDWARRLATQLVGDAQRADDLVQEAWLAAIKNPPSHAENLRGWFGSVVRRLAANEWRGDRRRSEREVRAARSEALPPTDQLVHEAQLSKELVEAVVAMPEPFKTVLLMRYFRDQKPAQIARELGRPLATVKTQIQRGLEKLREELDGRYGDRRSWCVALLPLVHKTGDAGTVGIALGVSVAAASALAIGWWSLVGWESARSMAPITALTSESQALGPAGSADPRSPIASIATEGQRTEELERAVPVADETPQQAVAIVPPRVVPLEGIVLDLEMRPVAGMPLRWIDPGALRWKDSGRDVITGKQTWVPVTAEQREQFRSDPSSLRVFAEENFARPELAIALLLGEAPAVHETRTDGDGRFRMELPDHSYEIETTDLDYGVLGRTRTLTNNGAEQLTWIVAPRRSLEGVVVDFRGKPVEGATVEISGVFPKALQGKLAMGNGFSSGQETLVTDEEGRFRLERAAVGGELELQALLGDSSSSYLKLQLPTDLDAEVEPISLRLNPTVKEAPRIVLEGRVVLDDGSPAPRATVRFAWESTTTDADGRYRLPALRLEGDLFAARSGSGIAVLPAPAEHQAGRGETLKLADLVLPRNSLAIEGCVQDSTGKALPGIRVEFSGGVPGGEDHRSLEDVAAGRYLKPVLTDERGCFRLEGLRDHEYPLSLWTDTAHKDVGTVHAGTKGVALVFP